MRGRGVYFNRTILDNDNSFARLGWYKWGLPTAILLRKNFLKNSYNFWKGNFWRVPPTYKKQKCETIFGSKLVFAQHAKVVCVLFPFSAHLKQVSQSQIEAESWRLLCKILTTSLCQQSSKYLTVFPAAWNYGFPKSQCPRYYKSSTRHVCTCTCRTSFWTWLEFSFWCGICDALHFDSFVTTICFSENRGVKSHVKLNIFIKLVWLNPVQTSLSKVFWSP